MARLEPAPGESGYFPFFQEHDLRKTHPSLCRSRFWREDISWYGTGPTADLSGDSRSLAFCRALPNRGSPLSYWEELEFQIQEGTAHWRRIVDTALPSPDDFSEHGLPLESAKYGVAPRSIVVLLRQRGSAQRP